LWHRCDFGVAGSIGRSNGFAANGGRFHVEPVVGSSVGVGRSFGLGVCSGLRSGVRLG
jgi:hypothetical protein